jgi:glycosyltransferase involved in cell wall biosynthesis
VNASQRVALTGLAPPFRGGIAQYTLHLASALSTLCRVRLYAFRQQYPDLLFPGTSQHDPRAARLPVEVVRSLTPTRPQTWVQTADLVAASGAGRLVHQWWHPWFAPATLVLLRRLARQGIPTTVVCHNVLPHEPLPAARLATRSALGPADRILVHGLSDADLASTLWPGAQVVVHPHPPYRNLAGPRLERGAARAKLGLPAGEPVVLFFGHVRGYKGLDDLVEAMAIVTHRIPAARLAVVGEFYEGRDSLRRRIGELELEERVTVIDRYVADDEVGTWMRAAHLVALPYRSATGSGVMGIARAAGVPVVSTRVGDLPDLMQEGRDGLLVPPCDPAALARAICLLIEDPPDGERIERASHDLGWSNLARAALTGEPG